MLEICLKIDFRPLSSLVQIWRSVWNFFLFEMSSCKVSKKSSVINQFSRLCLDANSSSKINSWQTFSETPKNISLRNQYFKMCFWKNHFVKCLPKTRMEDYANKRFRHWVEQKKIPITGLYCFRERSEETSEEELRNRVAIWGHRLQKKL